MLLVGDHMTREVVTTTPEATAAEVLALCRERGIRHMPVMKDRKPEDRKLVGMVSDRDLRSATPALGDPARAEALKAVTVEQAMNRDVITASPGDPIETAANAMRERSIGCLPVVEAGELVGIITTSDVMEALVYLVGAHEPGSRMEISMPDRPGTMAEVAGVFGKLGVNLVSVIASPEKRGSDGREISRVAVFRVATINPQEATNLLERAGYEVLWPPKTRP